MEFDLTMLNVLIVWIAATAMIVSLISIGRESDMKNSIVVNDSITNTTVDYSIDQDNGLKFYSSKITLSDDVDASGTNTVISDDTISFNSAGPTKIFNIVANDPDNGADTLSINYDTREDPILRITENTGDYYDEYYTYNGATGERFNKMTLQLLGNLQILNAPNDALTGIDSNAYSITTAAGDDNSPLVFYRDSTDTNDNTTYNPLFIFANSNTKSGAPTENRLQKQVHEGFYIKPNVSHEFGALGNNEINQVKLGFYTKTSSDNDAMNDEDFLILEATQNNTSLTVKCQQDSDDSGSLSQLRLRGTQDANGGLFIQGGYDSSNNYSGTIGFSKTSQSRNIISIKENGTLDGNRKNLVFSSGSNGAFLGTSDLQDFMKLIYSNGNPDNIPDRSFELTAGEKTILGNDAKTNILEIKSDGTGHETDHLVVSSGGGAYLGNTTNNTCIKIHHDGTSKNSMHFNCGDNTFIGNTSQDKIVQLKRETNDGTDYLVLGGGDAPYLGNSSNSAIVRLDNDSTKGKVLCLTGGQTTFVGNNELAKMIEIKKKNAGSIPLVLSGGDGAYLGLKENDDHKYVARLVADGADSRVLHFGGGQTTFIGNDVKNEIIELETGDNPNITSHAALLVSPLDDKISLKHKDSSTDTPKYYNMIVSQKASIDGERNMVIGRDYHTISFDELEEEGYDPRIQKFKTPLFRATKTRYQKLSNNQLSGSQIDTIEFKTGDGIFSGLNIYDDNVGGGNEGDVTFRHRWKDSSNGEHIRQMFHSTDIDSDTNSYLNIGAKYGNVEVFSTNFLHNGNTVSTTTFTGSHPMTPHTSKAITSNDTGKLVSSTGQVTNNNNVSDFFVSGLLSSKNNDKKVYGVLNEQNKVNSVGEGMIWVTNINGQIENGDYITTTTVPGYGGKQSDDLLHNYTAAKLVEDCPFDLTKIPKTKVQFLNPENTTNIPKKYFEEAIYDSDGNLDLEPVLDDQGNQVVDYKVPTRFVRADGSELADEQAYHTALAAGENVYIACFVGCTYHCG